MSRVRIVLLTVLTMVAFAGNSLLCRIALRQTGIDAATFTTVRLISGAVMLGLLVRLWRATKEGRGNWLSSLCLVAYAAGFSFAYLSLPAGTGALLLFGSVQATMIGYGLVTGERLRQLQWLGIALAGGGLVGLFLPGLSAPPWLGSLLMIGAGCSWGIYSLRGKKSGGDPMRVTAGNFLRAAPMSVGLSLLAHESASGHWAGFGCAVVSGALTSGIAYAGWYIILPELQSTTAATVQLSVPVIAALGGVVFLQESLTLRLAVAAASILGGISLVILPKKVAKDAG